ncbi:unnamed protein product [Pedinophyceae sp. YPF-701]|nr:unnamed protein product [Pedinophyceae sp. YPF-701]
MTELDAEVYAAPADQGGKLLDRPTVVNGNDSEDTVAGMTPEQRLREEAFRRAVAQVDAPVTPQQPPRRRYPVYSPASQKAAKPRGWSARLRAALCCGPARSSPAYPLTPDHPPATPLTTLNPAAAHAQRLAMRSGGTDTEAQVLRPEDSDRPAQYEAPTPSAALSPAPGRAPMTHLRPATERLIIGPQCEADRGKKCLVLDLDETLVHSSFKPVPNPDYIIPVEIEGHVLDVYVLKRPHLDQFMERMAKCFEIVVFTASLAKYADPLLDLLDTQQLVRWRLFREDCAPYEGNYVKDLDALGRDLASVIIIDNSPHSYAFQPENAVPITTFIDDPDDCELLELVPYLEALKDCDDVRPHLSAAAEALEAAGYNQYDQY